MWQLSCFTWWVPLACPTGGALRQAVAGAELVRMWILLIVYVEEDEVSCSATCGACWLVSGCHASPLYLVIRAWVLDLVRRVASSSPSARSFSWCTLWLRGSFEWPYLASAIGTVLCIAVPCV